MRRAGLGGVIALLTCVAAHADVNPSGVWRTISDTDGKPRALVKIDIHGGRLSGRVVGSLRPGEDPHRTCEACSGAQRGQRILGMEILGGLKPNPSNPLEYDAGWVLDPETGKTYQAKAALSPDGTRLVLRGFIGVSMLGRSQTWLRK